MSIISPEKIVFESQEDLVDFVTRGLVPSKKNFEKVMAKMYYPNADDEVRDPNSKELFIPERLFIQCDRDTMNIVLNRVYANRVRNRNIILVAAGVVGSVMLLGAIRGNKKKDDDGDYNSFSAGNYLDDDPVATIGDI